MGPLLAEPVPYDNAPGIETSLYEHLERAVQYTLERLGPHGLPLIGTRIGTIASISTPSRTSRGTIVSVLQSQDGKTAESVFIGGLFVLAADEPGVHQRGYACRRGGEALDVRPAAAQFYREAARQMRETALAHGAGTASGSYGLTIISGTRCSREDEGRLFIEPQGMCVMAGIAESGHVERALTAVAQHLATPHGIMLNQPAYTRYQASNWARSLPIRRATRRTPASFATPTRGS